MHHECLDNNKIHSSTAIYTHVIPNATNNSFCNTLTRFTNFRVRISNIALNNSNETWVTQIVSQQGFNKIAFIREHDRR